MCIDAPESTTNSLSSGLGVDGASKHIFPKVRRLLFFVSRSISGYFWPASKLLHGHIALATLSLPETDPQILEHWGYADDDHLGKSFQATDFCLECYKTQNRLLQYHLGVQLDLCIFGCSCLQFGIL